MEPPSKRMRISDSDNRSPRNAGSQMAEGLFTSEKAIQSDDSDNHNLLPTRTINPSDFQRRALYGDHSFKNPYLRRSAGIYLLPRAPDATVTSNAIVVNVNDGTQASVATTLPAVTAETVVSINDKGQMTIPAPVPGTTTESGASSASSITSSSSSSSSYLSIVSTIVSDILNGTSTVTGQRTVTVTSTSTLEVSFINGTLIPNTQSSNGTATLTHSTHPANRTSTVAADAETSTLPPSGIGVSDDSSPTPTPSPGIGGPLLTPSSTSTDAATSTSKSDDSDSGGPGLSPQQQNVVGGVVGGVAGVALVLVLLLVVLKWYRRRLKARGELPEQRAQRDLITSPGGATVSQRSSTTPLTAVLATSLRKLRPISGQTQGTATTATTVPESERGFQKIAGRKIAPVLGTGGDEYGGSYGAFEKGTAGNTHNHTRAESSLAGSSFYRDSRGFYGGKGPTSPIYPPSPTLSSAGGRSVTGHTATHDFAARPATPSQVSLPSSRPEGKAALRPSPARTPVTVSPSPSSIRLPIQQSPTMDDAPPVPALSPGLAVPSGDGIGRTLANLDGSHVSGTSRGSGRSRFAENM